MADDLDANISDVVTPALALPLEQPKRAAGKRAVVANKLYSMDMYNRDQSDDPVEKKGRSKRCGRASEKKYFCSDLTLSSTT
jgi:hypothetical protein